MVSLLIRMKKILLALLTILTVSAQGAGMELFVAPADKGGDDNNPGTKEKPLATLSAARDILRNIQKQKKIPPEGGAIVNLLPGDYYIDKTIDFEYGDNGRLNRRIIYRSLSGAEPARFIGGRSVTNFVLLEDADIQKRLPAATQGKIWTADLKALGLENFGQMRSRGFARSTVPAHCELFYDGRPMTLAQWPNKGKFSHIAGYPEGTQKDGHGGELSPLENGYFYEGDRPGKWLFSEGSDIWAHGYWAWDWANSYEKILSIDPEKKWIKTAGVNYGFRKGQRVYYVNILEELDQPGEYYVDTAKGILYFYPPQDGKPDKEAFVSGLESPFIRSKEASFLTFENITFTACRGEALHVEDGTSVIVKNCRFINIGSTALSISNGSGCMVINCDFAETGDSGVTLSGGNRQTLKPCGHIVQDCIFQKQGRWSRCYVPAISINGVGIQARHNLIFDHPHCAILYGGNDHTIEFNEIHHVALETGDVGAIYAGRDYTMRGNKIQFNYIHHTGGVGMGSMGIYNDDSLSGTYMYGNLFHKVQRAVFMGGGRDFVVQNNVFVDCTPSIALDGRGLDKSPVWYNQVYVTLKERLKAVPRDVYEKRYPEIYNVEKYLSQTNGVPPENILIKNNISFGGQWKNVGWHAKDEDVTWVDNFVDQDPGFVDAEHGNFNLKADSPAFKTGFKALPLDQIGPRRMKVTE